MSKLVDTIKMTVDSASGYGLKVFGWSVGLAELAVISAVVVLVVAIINISRRHSG